MAIVDGDVLRVSANFELPGGHLYQNIYTYIRDGTDPFSDAAHIAAIKAGLEGAYDEILAQVQENTTAQLSSVDRIEFNEITDTWEVVENIGTFTLSFTPIGTGDGLPFQSSPYVIFKTQRPRSTGKKFLFPFIETQQISTILVAGAVTAVTAYAAAALADINLGGDATLAPAVVRTGVQSVLLLLVAVVSDVLGTQRRRKPGVGA